MHRPLANRGAALALLSQNACALADDDMAIRLEPNQPLGYVNRGQNQTPNSSLEFGKLWLGVSDKLASAKAAILRAGHLSRRKEIVASIACSRSFPGHRWREIHAPRYLNGSKLMRSGPQFPPTASASEAY